MCEDLPHCWVCVPLRKWQLVSSNVSTDSREILLVILVISTPAELSATSEKPALCKSLHIDRTELVSQLSLSLTGPIVMMVNDQTVEIHFTNK